jgi:hypothetical protein
MTNLEVARRATQIAKRASSWSFDALTMGDERLHEQTPGNSAERFCQEIREMLDRISSSTTHSDGESDA